MANYYTYDFVSPEEIYAEVKAEMRSYFNTGVINDTLFPIYTRKCIRKLNRSTYDIDETILKLDNYSADLPLGFQFVRELWVCTNVTETRKVPGGVYHQETCVVSPYGDYDRCNPCNTCPPDCNSEHKIYYKTTEFYHFRYNISHLLKPGNLSVRSRCSPDCINFADWISDIHTFDIRGNKVYTNFENGYLRLVYYKEPLDEEGDIMIPDNFFIQEYIKAYLKYKMYEQIYNEVTDETFNQVAQKYAEYKQQYYDAHILADAEVKKQTVYQKRRSIQRMRSRLYPYIIR